MRGSLLVVVSADGRIDRVLGTARTNSFRNCIGPRMRQKIENSFDFLPNLTSLPSLRLPDAAKIRGQRRRCLAWAIARKCVAVAMGYSIRCPCEVPYESPGTTKRSLATKTSVSTEFNFNCNRESMKRLPLFYCQCNGHHRVTYRYLNVILPCIHESSSCIAKTCVICSRSSFLKLFRHHSPFFSALGAGASGMRRE